MSTISAVSDALETTIENVSGLRVYSEAEDIIAPPACVINLSSVEFAQAMNRGLDQMNFELYIIVPRQNLRSAIDSLEAYTTGSGSKSIRQQLFNSPGLGLSDTTARAVRISGADNVTVNGIDCLGTTMEVQVHTKGSA